MCGLSQSMSSSLKLALSLLAGRPAYWMPPSPPHTLLTHAFRVCAWRSPDSAQRFIDTLPDARLVWVEECGHCAHLEQPQALLHSIAEFVAGQQGAVAEGAEMTTRAA